MNGINAGIYEKAFPPEYSFEQKLRSARLCGFDRLEISIDETEEKLGRLYDKTVSDALSSAIREIGLPVTTMCLSAHRKYPLGGRDGRNLEIMRGAIELSEKLGIRIIQLAGYDVYYEPSTEETKERFLENLYRCVSLASYHGVLLGFETMETDFMNTVEKAMKYVRLINSPYLQIYPDLGNISNAAEAFVQPGEAVCPDPEKTEVYREKHKTYKAIASALGKIKL